MTFLTLSEYLAGARKIMVAQKCGFLINDEDAVADVANRMMVADQTWNGTTQRCTWRYTQAKYALMRILSKRKKRRKTFSLDDVHWDNKLYKNQDTHRETYDTFMMVCEKAKDILNSRQYDCVIKYYKDHMTMEDIGRELGISKQCVSQHISKGVNKIRKCLSKLD